MTDEQIRQRVASNSIEFCAMLRSGQYGDFRKYMTPDLKGVGVNGQILCVQLATNLEAEHKFIPEVSDYIEAWMSCWESGLLVEIPQVGQQQPQRGKTATEMEGELIAKELELQRKQKRQQAEPPKAENELFHQLKQGQLDEETINALRSDCNSAQTKLVLKHGVVNHGETNSARTAELLRLKTAYSKQFPKLASRIEEEVNKAANGMGLTLQAEQPLPESPTEQQLRAASPEEIKRWRARHRNKQNPENN